MSEPIDILANAIVVGPNMGPTEAEPDPQETPPAAEPLDRRPGQAAETPAPSAPSEEEPAPGEDAPAADEDEEPAQEDPAARRRNGIQERFSTLTAKIRAAETEANYWKQRALEQTPQPQARPQPQTAPNGQPLPDQYPTHEGYQADLIRWHVGQALTEERRAVAHAQSLAAVREAHPDFDTVVGNSHIFLNDDVVAALQASEQFEPLRYYLATHPEETALVNQLRGRQADRAIGFLEGKILAEQGTRRGNGATNGTAEPAPPRTTQAPPPITPTRANGTVRVPRGYDELSLDEFIRQRNKEERESRL